MLCTESYIVPGMDIYYISCVVLPLQYSVSRTIYIKVNSINEHGTKHLLSKLSKVKGISARVCCGYFFFLSSSPCVSVYWCTISRYTFSLIFIRRFATSVHLRSPAKNFKILLAYAVEIMFRYFIRALMKFTRKKPKTKKFLFNHDDWIHDSEFWRRLENMFTLNWFNRLQNYARLCYRRNADWKTFPFYFQMTKIRIGPGKCDSYIWAWATTVVVIEKNCFKKRLGRAYKYFFP